MHGRLFPDLPFTFPQSRVAYCLKSWWEKKEVTSWNVSAVALTKTLFIWKAKINWIKRNLLEINAWIVVLKKKKSVGFVGVCYESKKLNWIYWQFCIKTCNKLSSGKTSFNYIYFYSFFAVWFSEYKNNVSVPQTKTQNICSSPKRTMLTK